MASGERCLAGHVTLVIDGAIGKRMQSENGNDAPEGLARKLTPADATEKRLSDVKAILFRHHYVLLNENTLS